MKRSLGWTILFGLVFVTFLSTGDAWARTGGGTSTGSRGSRTYSAPVRPAPSPAVPSRPAPSPPSVQAPQPSGWMGGLMGGIGGFFLGGLLGSVLFGGMGRGLFGGIGLLDILIFVGVIYLGVSLMRRRGEPTPAGPPGYAPPPPGYEATRWGPESQSSATMTLDASAALSDLESGVRHIRQLDPGFDPKRFTETASDCFFKLQAAWMARDMGSVRDLLTAEICANFRQECDRLRSARRVNRLENIAVRAVEMTEAWQESGQDFVTVRFLASLLDYTVDETTNQVIEGSQTEPVKFEEYWTFVRPVGPNPWRLSAIQQGQ